MVITSFITGRAPILRGGGGKLLLGKKKSTKNRDLVLNIDWGFVTIGWWWLRFQICFVNNKCIWN